MNENLKWIWLYKYSDDLANFFGSILVLCVGLLIFFGIASPFDSNLNLYLAAIVLIGIFAYFLMMHFSLKVPMIAEYNVNHKHKNMEYIITSRRLDTLAAAGVAEDIIKCLNDSLEKVKTEEKILKMTITPESENSWLKALKDELGESRISEYEESILKYTSREIPNT